MGKTNRLGDLRAKAALYDELVERLTDAEDELDRLRRSRAPVAPARSVGDEVDPAWRLIANDLAGALRPYTLFKDQAGEDGRIVVHTRVPGSTLSQAREALDRLGRQVAVESCRRDGIPVAADQAQAGERAA